MKFVLAPDSFKESLTAKEVADAMEVGIKKIFKDAECVKVPMADGGEGTVQSLVDATDGKIYEVVVTGPLGNKVNAKYGILGDGQTAVIEMAEASGIHYVKKEDRNPLITTTFGTGELIKSALDKGVKKIIIGIGGSATNDGGAGMLQALGAKLLDKDNKEIPFGGGGLSDLVKINLDDFDKRIKEVEIEVACDVSNTLTGKEGASAVFGPQKGATEEIIKILDENFQKFMEVDFTADMESQLDQIEEGNVEWKKVVEEFYSPLAEAIRVAIEKIEKVNMDEETDEICELCGSNMVIKYGRFGKFMACKNYPECKNTKPIVNKIGVKCPKCKEGDIIMRKSKKKKVFYGCSNYPECDFVAWNKPVEEPCEECGSYMYEKYSKSGTKIVCSNKDCKHERIVKEE